MSNDQQKPFIHAKRRSSMNAAEISRIEQFRQFKKEIRGSKEYLIVGIDIAKKKHYAFLGNATGKTLKRGLTFENEASGFEHLLDQVQFYVHREGLDKTVFGVEPTGVYHKPLAEFLIESDHLVVYVTNAAIKHNRSLLDGRWDRNDTKDSANVADLISQGKCHYYDLPDIDIRDIRSLLSLRARLKKSISSYQTRIRNNLVAQYFPELDDHWNQAQKENMAIVRWCLSPQKISQLEFQDFHRMVTTKNRGLPQYRRLDKIWQLAPYSIGCRSGVGLELEAEMMVTNLTELRSQICEVEQCIEDICEGFEEYRYLLTIPGFGPYVAAVVLAAIGNPHRFENTKQVIRLAGYDLNANRSGKRSRDAIPVISKSGKAQLRYALFQAALVASSRTRPFCAYFNKLLEGRQQEPGIRTKMRVKLAVKLLVIAWTLMKQQQPFDQALLQA
jgi:transposase